VATLTPVDYDPFAKAEPKSSPMSYAKWLNPVAATGEVVAKNPRTALEQALQGATYNFGDEVSDRIGANIAYAADKIQGVDGGSVNDIYNWARKDTQKRLAKQLRETPKLAIGSQIAGGLLTGGAGATTKTGATLANSLRTGGLGLRAIKAALLGAASGAASGFGAGSGAEDRLDRAGNSAVAGGVVGGTIPVMGAAADSVGKGVNLAKTGFAARSRDELIESGQELKDVVSAAYKKVDEAGASLTPQASQELINGMESNLAKIELIPELNPKTLGVVNYIKNAAAKGELKVTQVDQYRRLLSGIKDEDGVAASAARKGIDDFLSALDETKLSGGDVNVGKYLLDARRAASQNFRFSKVSEILQKADGDPNKIKSGLTSLLNKKGATSGWSQDEVAALREAASASTPEKLLKMAGKFGLDLGTSTSIGNTVAPLVGSAVGGAAGGLSTAGVVPVAGTAARYGQKLAARGKAENLLRTIEGATVEKGGLPALISADKAGQVAVPAAAVTGGAVAQQPNVPQAPAPRLTPIDYDPFAAQPQASASPLAERIRTAESNGDPNAKNPNSSASGLYQFTDSTWRSAVDKWGRSRGIKYGDKNNPQAQEILMQELTKDNARILQNKGIEPTDGNLYFAHFMGAPAASKAISMLGKNAIAARSFPDAAKANPTIFFSNGKPRTIDEVYQLITNKVA